MKLVFVSNFLNIHQIPLCESFYEKIGDGFTFIETAPVDDDRLEMGFQVSKYPYVRSFIDTNQKAECERIIVESDVAIFGSAPDQLFNLRINTGKITFKYSERFFKGSGSFLDNIRFWLCSLKHIKPLKNKNVYFLCASAYTASDVNRFVDFSGRCFKWGYFREILPVNPSDLIKNKTPNSILWVGRMIDWKHPEMAVLLAKKLKEEGIPFSLTMVGTGTEFDHINDLINEYQLKDFVSLVGSQTPDEVRNLMNQSEIFIGTSDFKEGWGVVINEALNSSCAVVASHATGSVPFLIQDGVNGVVFESGNQESLNQKVMNALKDRENLQRIQTEAYRQLSPFWNAQIATERFLKLSSEILKKQPITAYSEGPCSNAEILPNDWFHEN